MINRFNIFNNPEKSQILWHDIKKFSSAANIYFENIEGEIYGKMPLKLKRAIRELKVGNIKNMILIENVSIAKKIYLKSLKINKRELPLNIISNNAIAFIRPLAQTKHLKIKSIKTESKINIDTRYSSTILQNIFMLAINFAKDKALIETFFEENHIQIVFETTETLKGINKQLLTKNIFSPKSKFDSLPSLVYYTLKQLAEKNGFKFKVTIKNSKMTILYAPK